MKVAPWVRFTIYGGVLGTESCPLGAFYRSTTYSYTIDQATYSNTVGRILSVYMLQVCTRVF
jgi:hypothetical protein